MKQNLEAQVLNLRFSMTPVLSSSYIQVPILIPFVELFTRASAVFKVPYPLCGIYYMPGLLLPILPSTSVPRDNIVAMMAGLTIKRLQGQSKAQLISYATVVPPGAKQSSRAQTRTKTATTLPERKWANETHPDHPIHAKIRNLEHPIKHHHGKKL